MVFISDFADQAIVLPLAAMVALVLGVMGWWRGLLAWGIAVVATLGVMLALKLSAIILADAFAWASPASPSGHVASACVVYGGLAVLLLRGAVPIPLLALVVAGIAVVMGYSRVELLAHDIGEVVTGALVGSLGVLGLAIMAGPRPRWIGWPVVGAAACTMVVFHGMHLPAEAAIRSVLELR